MPSGQFLMTIWNRGDLQATRLKSFHEKSTMLECVHVGPRNIFSNDFNRAGMSFHLYTRLPGEIESNSSLNFTSLELFVESKRCYLQNLRRCKGLRV